MHQLGVNSAIGGCLGTREERKKEKKIKENKRREGKYDTYLILFVAGVFSYLTRHPFSHVNEAWLEQNFVIVSFSVTFLLFFLILIHRAVQPTKSRLELARKIGLGGIFSQVSPLNLLGAFVYSGLYYGTYDTLKANIGSVFSFAFRFL